MEKFQICCFVVKKSFEFPREENSKHENSIGSQNKLVLEGPHLGFGLKTVLIKFT